MKTPEEMVNQLNKYIIGQTQAKRSVAIALRNRWRRLNIRDKNIKNEINPKNILMIGPTGVGKTTIAKKIAKLVFSPFIKVEATKFTEVGYVGKEVESIIKDLADISFKITKEKYIRKNKFKAKKIVENKIINFIIKNEKLNILNDDNKNIIKNDIKSKLRKGLLNNKEIEINLNKYNSILGLEIISNTSQEDINNQLQYLLKNSSNNKKNKVFKTNIKNAIKILMDEELNNLLNLEEIKKKSVKLTEEQGIVFIDEIDKICNKNCESNNIDVSREGVQRDLLPIVEGCSINTKYGYIKTDYILFIASGSFKNISKEYLIPELQGRFPIKVKLEKLTIKDFEKILTQTKYSLIKQYIALFSTEGIKIEFTKCGIKKISEISWIINEEDEDIGARRLYYVIEKIMEDISFIKFDCENKNILINENYIKSYEKDLIKKNNNNDIFML